MNHPIARFEREIGEMLQFLGTCPPAQLTLVGVLVFVGAFLLMQMGVKLTQALGLFLVALTLIWASIWAVQDVRMSPVIIGCILGGVFLGLLLKQNE